MNNLSTRGYTLLKEKLTSSQIAEVKRDLTVTPYVNTGFSAPKNPFPIYGESARKLYVPRFYGIQKFGLPCNSKLNEPLNVDMSFKHDMRPLQKPIVEKFIDTVMSHHMGGGGIISVPCGYGKTVIALKIMTELKVKTLIVVHQDFLIDQWIERIDFFIEGAVIGRIKGKLCKIQGKNIVIATLQTLAKKDFQEDTFKDFGFVIYDECHHLGAEFFSKALLKTNFRYLLGLSATPNRADGLRKVFEWYLGPPIYTIKKRSEEELVVKAIKFYDEDISYSKEVLNYMGKPQMSSMINNICDFEPRTQLILKEIETALKDDRKILLLSDRREHLKQIKELIESKLDKYSAGYYLGGMKQKDRSETEKCDVILGTFQMASEGFDCKYPLHTIILASPKTNIEQAVGRILRQEASKRTKIPQVIDIQDHFSMFINQARKRMDFYKKNKYLVRIYDKEGNLVEELIPNTTKKQSKVSEFIDEDD